MKKKRSLLVLLAAASVLACTPVYTAHAEEITVISKTSVSGEDIADYASSWDGKVYYAAPGQARARVLSDGAVSDCSWFVYSVLNHFGLMKNYARSSAWGQGKVPGASKVEEGIAGARPGDIEYWDEGNGAGHVAVYLGDGKAAACNGYFTESYKKTHNGHTGEVEVTDYKTTIGRDPDSIWRTNGVVNVSAKASSDTFSNENYEVLGNIIGGVESGGQVYGNKRYGAYDEPYTNSSKERTITIGWPQFYGSEAEELITRIKRADPSGFAAADKDGKIAAALSLNWESMGWNPSAFEKDVIIRLITSDAGKKMQDQMFRELMSSKVKACEDHYTKDPRAVAMYVEIAHLGGKKPAERIFDRLNGDYSVDSIMASLKKDQDDASGSNQVGDRLYQSRHEKCAAWVKAYIKDNSEGTEPMALAGKEEDPALVKNSGRFYIKAQPDTKVLKINELNTFRCAASEDAGTVYQWQVKEPGKNWRDFSEKKTAETPELVFTVTDAMNGWKIRCHCANGSAEAYSDMITFFI